MSPPVPAPDADSDARQILRGIRRLVRGVDLHSRRLRRESGLTLPQVLCLRAIHLDPEQRLSSVDELLDGLELHVGDRKGPTTRIGLPVTGFAHSPDDTAEYIRFRLDAIGCTREIYTSDAIAMLHEAALGSLREIDRVATAAMRSAARKKRKLVERDIVEHVLAAHRGTT